MTENASGRPAEDSVVLSDEEQALEILRKSVFRLWDVVNNLTRLKPTRRPEFRVSIFGSARIPTTIGCMPRFAISPGNLRKWAALSLRGAVPD